MRLKILIVLVLFGLVLAGCQAEPEATGFYTNGRFLHDVNGNPFIIRGVSHPHTWFPNQTGAFADIKSLGANGVRVVLSSGDRWNKNSADDVANVIQLCKENRLVCILEVHDTTGFGDDSAAGTIPEAVDYWLEIQEVLMGEEATILVNIANEPYGNQATEGWLDDTINAIARLREAGFEHTIVVDAPHWGQDWQGVMRDHAQQVFESDPNGNILFDVHMYGVYETETAVIDYLTTFIENDLPIIVGEFGHNHSDGDPDEDAIMAFTVANDIGYIGWSWSGNGGGVEYLDMTNNFDVNSLTPWGERIFLGPNGIQETAVEATVWE